MKLTSKMAGIGLVATAALMLAGAGIADTMGGKMGGPGGMMGPMPDFAEVDADKDGKVSKAEIEAFHAARLAGFDTDKDGKLSAEELAAMHLQIMTERANDMAARMIEHLDSDGDGLLSSEEMTERPMSDRMFDRLDANDDGFIDQAEIDNAKQRMQERMGGMRGHGHGHGGGWMMGGDD